MHFILTHKTLRINFLKADMTLLNNSLSLRASFVSYLIIKYSLTIASVFTQACVAMVTTSVAKSQPCHQTLRSCPILSVFPSFVHFTTQCFESQRTAQVSPAEANVARLKTGEICKRCISCSMLRGVGIAGLTCCSGDHDHSATPPTSPT